MRNIVFLMLGLALWTGCGKQQSTRAQRKEVLDVVFASGNLALETEYALTANADGFLQVLNLREGDSVSPGMVLCQVADAVQQLQTANAQTNFEEAASNAASNSPKLQQLVLQLEQAKVARELDRKNLERYEQDVIQPRLQQLSEQLAQAQEALALDQKNYQRYQNLLQAEAVPPIEFDRKKLQYEQSLKQVAVLEKNLKEKQALTDLEYDKLKLQYEQSKSQVNVLEKQIADLQKSLNQSLKNSRNQLALQQEVLGDYSPKATGRGIVLEVMKEKGEWVRRGEVIARIGSGQPIPRLFVAEEDINKIRIGQQVELSLNTDKSRTFPATISKIYPALNAREQSFVVEAVFAETPPNLRSGTQLQANIVVEVKKNALILDRKYLRKGDKVLLAKDKTEKEVLIGLRNAAWVEVLEGISEQDEVLLK